MKTVSLERFCYHPTGTLGVVKVDSETFYSIERPWLDNEANVSCIPEGTYEMAWRLSPRFGWTWHVKNVSERIHILINVANFPKDVQGCIGLGSSLMGDKVAVSMSKDAVRRFEALTKGTKWQLVITNAPHAAL